MASVTVGVRGIGGGDRGGEEGTAGGGLGSSFKTCWVVATGGDLGSSEVGEAGGVATLGHTTAVGAAGGEGIAGGEGTVAGICTVGFESETAGGKTGNTDDVMAFKASSASGGKTTGAGFDGGTI